jgi:hypothetical protein
MRVQPVLDEQGIARHAKAEDEVDDPGEAKPVNNVVGVDQFGSENDARNDPRRSNSATIETSEVSLNRPMKLLTRLG